MCTLKITFKKLCLLSLFVFVSQFLFAQSADRNQPVEAVKNSLQFVTQLEPKMIKAGSYGQPHYGFTAEDLQKVFPGAVKSEKKFVLAGKNNFKLVTVKRADLDALIPLLVGSIKEQQAEIEKLKQELSTLKENKS